MHMTAAPATGGEDNDADHGTGHRDPGELEGDGVGVAHNAGFHLFGDAFDLAKLIDQCHKP